MMAKKVFIASPNDCNEEREVARQVIQDASVKIERDFGVRLVPVMWDDMAPILEPEDLTPWQDRINRELRTCDIFVGILNRKYGTPIPAFNNLSGTHYEFMQAIPKAPGVPVMTYYRDNSASGGDTPELKMLKDYLAASKIPYHTHKTAAEFRHHFESDLQQAFERTMAGRQRKKNLKWIIRYDGGATAGDFFKIVYPPIHHTSHQDVERQTNWKQRLMPDVVFEDFKAIEKISTSISLIGGAYEVETSDLPGVDHFEGNAIWLCLPRNEIAQWHLGNIRDNGSRNVRFRFKEGLDSPTQATERKILWKDKNGKEIEVGSPLSQYLDMQRDNSFGKWNIGLADIYARDFAVIARFKRGVSYSNQTYYHYFVAGIRGLGTWGAGSCFGRWHQVLANVVTGDDDFQELVQVSYDRCKIHKVRIVSNEDQDYFDKEMSPETIKRRITKHRHL